MANQILVVFVSVLSAVYGAIFATALKKIRNFPIALEEIAPDTKPTLSPSQQANIKDKAKQEMIAGGIITIVLIGLLILSLSAPAVMSWSTFSVDRDSDTYTYLQIAGLLCVGWSWLIEWRCMKAFGRRIDYLTGYYSLPVESRPSRSVEKELDVLRHGPYRFVRDPLSAAFHGMVASIVLTGQSWFLGILFSLLMLGNEVVIVEMDGKWRRFFLQEAFDTYMDGTGGQCLCTCFNGFEKRIRRRIEEKFARLADQDGFNNDSSTDSRRKASVVYIGKGIGAPNTEMLTERSTNGSVELSTSDTDGVTE